MSTTETNFEQLLRDAIQKTKESAPRAVTDLYRVASQASEAVDRVTEGTAVLELVVLNQQGTPPTTYELQLRKVHSEAPASDLGVYQITTAGYPIQRWYTYRGWQTKPTQPDEEFSSAVQLEAHFTWMVSDPESRLVVLVSFFQDQLRYAETATGN